MSRRQSKAASPGCSECPFWVRSGNKSHPYSAGRLLSKRAELLEAVGEQIVDRDAVLVAVALHLVSDSRDRLVEFGLRMSQCELLLQEVRAHAGDLILVSECDEG